jgi:hypothetical protein
MPADVLHQGVQYIYYDVPMLRDTVCPNIPTFVVLASLDSVKFNILQHILHIMHLHPFD